MPTIYGLSRVTVYSCMEGKVQEPAMNSYPGWRTVSFVCYANPFTMSKTACAQFTREVYGEGTMFEFWRGGDLYECGVPGEGEKFASAPAGTSKEETQCAMYNILQEHSPGYLESWIEWKFKQIGRTVIFTPPYAYLFRYQKLIWADAKGDLARTYFKGRTMQ